MNQAAKTKRESGFTVVGNLLYFVLGLIELLLVFRLLLAWFGANRDNQFAGFVFDLSAPLVAPFQGLFNFQSTIGSPRFEFETLIALFVYAAVGGIIGMLLQPSRR